MERTAFQIAERTRIHVVVFDEVTSTLTIMIPHPMAIPPEGHIETG